MGCNNSIRLLGTGLLLSTVLAGSCQHGYGQPTSTPRGQQGSALRGSTAKNDGYPVSHWRKEVRDAPGSFMPRDFPLIKGGAAAVPVLIELLQDDDQIVRNGAAECLQSIGPAARLAVPALARALLDKLGRGGA